MGPGPDGRLRDPSHRAGAGVGDRARPSYTGTPVSATIDEDDAMIAERLERIGAVAPADRNEAVAAHLLAAGDAMASSAAL